jgi:hypothetical protein
MIRHKVIIDTPTVKSFGDSKLIRSHNRLKEVLPVYEKMDNSTPYQEFISVYTEVMECKMITKGSLITTVIY